MAKTRYSSSAVVRKNYSYTMKYKFLKTTTITINTYAELSTEIISDKFSCFFVVHRAYLYIKDMAVGPTTFKVIDVGTTGKLVSSACYDKQQVCVYLQRFSR